MSALQEAGHIKNVVAIIFPHILDLQLMNSDVDWGLVSSGTQVQRQIIFDTDDFPDYLLVSYDYVSYDCVDLWSVYSFLSPIFVWSAPWTSYCFSNIFFPVKEVFKITIGFKHFQVISATNIQLGIII